MFQSPILFCCCIIVAAAAFAARGDAFVLKDQHRTCIGTRKQQPQDSRLKASLSTTWTAAAAAAASPANSTFFNSYQQDSLSSSLRRRRPSSKRILSDLQSNVASAASKLVTGATSSNAPTTARCRTQAQEFKVFCDLDGVLCDFESGIRKLFPNDSIQSGFHVDKLHRGTMWKRVAASNAFFEHLPWNKGGKRLWNSIRHLQPDILTGVPVYRSSRSEKVRWCRRELGVRVRHVDMAGYWNDHSSVNGVTTTTGEDDDDGHCNVITCWSNNKYHESGPGRVLIDDRYSLAADWEAAGGIFVHHTGDVDATLRKLEQVGVL